MLRSNHNMGLCAIALLAAAALAGCSGRNGITASNFLPGKKNMRPIARIECIWQAAEGRNPKGLPCRGLAGRVLFFPAGSERPAKVEGKGRVVVYCFDDQGSRNEQAKPIHKFQFALDAWNLHYRESALGPSYDVFIPYMRDVNHRVNMTAHVRLVPEKGPLATSKMLTVTLPGPKQKFNNEALVHHVTPKRNNAKTRVSTVSQDSPRYATNNFDLGKRNGDVQQTSAYRTAPQTSGSLAERFEQAVKDGKVTLPKRLRKKPVVVEDGKIHRQTRQIKPDVKVHRFGKSADNQAAERQPVNHPTKSRIGITLGERRFPSQRHMPTAFHGNGRFAPPSGSDPRARSNRPSPNHPLLGGRRATRQPRQTASRAPVRDLSGRPLNPNMQPRTPVQQPQFADEPVERTQTRALFERESAKSLFPGE